MTQEIKDSAIKGLTVAGIVFVLFDILYFLTNSLTIDALFTLLKIAVAIGILEFIVDQIVSSIV
jgi:hypothetical protein